MPTPNIPTLVMKFGGASMAQIPQFSLLAELIENRLKIFPRIVAVVSAMGSTTDKLLQMAQKVHPNPPKREQDMLVSAGERVSMSLLAMALDLRGIKAISFTGSQSGIITTSQHTDADILEVRPARIEEQLHLGKVVIVAGFQGVSLEKEVTTLGRGGSDTSAVFLAHFLRAEKSEFYKDVEGIGDKNPKLHPDAKIFTHLSYEKALEIVSQGAKVLHPRAIECAKKYQVLLEVRSFLYPEKSGTQISHKERCI